MVRQVTLAPGRRASQSALEAGKTFPEADPSAAPRQEPRVPNPRVVTADVTELSDFDVSYRAPTEPVSGRRTSRPGPLAYHSGVVSSLFSCRLSVHYGTVE